MFFTQCIVPDCGRCDYVQQIDLSQLPWAVHTSLRCWLGHMTCFGQKDVRACDISRDLKGTCTEDFGVLHFCLSP